MSARRLAELNADELARLPRERTVVFLAAGPLEDHGPHLPVGLDLLEAERMCWLAAERLARELPEWHALVAPAVPLGVDANTGRLAATVRGYALRDFLVDFCGSLARDGFVHFVCFSGHAGPRQLTAIEEAGWLLRRRNGGGWLRRAVSGRPVPTLVSADSALVRRETAFRSPLWSDPVEHGGAADTSAALAIGASVDPRYASLPAARRPDSFFERAWRRLRRTEHGYWGDPSKATAEAGERRLRERLDEIFPKLRAVWEGAEPTRLFRSGYAIFPSNGSYFRAWLYALALVGLLSVWVWLNVRGMLTP